MDRALLSRVEVLVISTACRQVTLWNCSVLSWPGMRSRKEQKSSQRRLLSLERRALTTQCFSLYVSADVSSYGIFDLCRSQAPAASDGWEAGVQKGWLLTKYMSVEASGGLNTVMSWLLQMEHDRIKIIMLIEINPWHWLEPKTHQSMISSHHQQQLRCSYKAHKPISLLAFSFCLLLLLPLCLPACKDDVFEVENKSIRKHLHLICVHCSWPVDKHMLLCFSKPWCPSSPCSLRVYHKVSYCGQIRLWS